MLFLQSWDSYFRAVQAGAQPGQAYVAPPTLRPAGAAVGVPSSSGAVMAPMATVSGDMKSVVDHLNVQNIIYAFQVDQLF